MRAVFSFRLPSFDDLIGSEQECGRNREAKGGGGLSVDDEFDRRRLLDGEIRRLCALENPIGIVGGAPRDVGHVCPIGEQSTFVDIFAHRIDRRQPVRRGESDDWPRF